MSIVHSAPLATRRAHHPVPSEPGCPEQHERTETPMSTPEIITSAPAAPSAVQPAQAAAPAVVPAQATNRLPHLQFGFTGGAGSWLWVGIAGFLVTAFTLGICYPWAVVMTYRWKTKHTWINGQRLRFTGSAPGLFGHWIKWFFLCVITVGIYSFWVYPRLQKWIVEHQEIDPTS